MQVQLSVQPAEIQVLLACRSHGKRKEVRREDSLTVPGYAGFSSLPAALHLLSQNPVDGLGIQGFELAQPELYLIYEQLEHVKGPVPQVQSCRISMIQVTTG